MNRSKYSAPADAAEDSGHGRLMPAFARQPVRSYALLVATETGFLAPAFGWTRLPGVLKAVQRIIRPTTREPLMDAVREAAVTVGSRLLESENRADLGEAADELIISEEFERARRALLDLVRSVPSSFFEELPTEGEPSEALIASLGLGPAQSLLNGLGPLMKIGASAYQQLLSRLPREISDQALDPLANLTNGDLPSPLRRLLLHAFRAEAYSFALIAAVENGQRLEPWLSQALVEGLIAGERSRLRVLASIPGVRIPLSVIPSQDRLDANSLDEAAQATGKIVAAWSETASRSGEDAYFPFGAPDDEAC